MAAVSTEVGFFVWGIDQTAYGPVELPTLVSWIKDERVTAETWIFASQTETWQKAGQTPELQMFFRRKGPAAASSAQAAAGLQPGMLRRVKIMANMTEAQLDHFVKFVLVEKVPQWHVVVKQGDHGDAMYLILEGELRVRLDVMGKETILATLGPGEFFGDISLFDQGPRSADVVANMDSVIVKVTAKDFENLAKEAPELATPFLLAIGKTLTARIRADNKRFGDSIKFARAAT
jgi:hypothetical protein